MRLSNARAAGRSSEPTAKSPDKTPSSAGGAATRRWFVPLSPEARRYECYQSRRFGV